MRTNSLRAEEIEARSEQTQVDKLEIVAKLIAQDAEIDPETYCFNSRVKFGGE